MKSFKLTANAVVLLLLLAPGAYAAFIGPTPYLCFDASAIANCNADESPFAGTDFSGGYVHLENFEDGVLDTLGATSFSGEVTGPGGITDSVDEDDGTIDGSGQLGRSYFSSNGAAGLIFLFDAVVALGTLPTHVGIVWTDGAAFNEVTFEAFDGANNSLGSIVAPNIGDGNFGSMTAEDRFFGIIDFGGISRIKIHNSMLMGGGLGIEADHLQYGLTVPISATLPLLVFGLAGLGLRRRHRRH